MSCERLTNESTLFPIASNKARLRVTTADGAAVVLVRHDQATAGVRLTANEARVLANMLNSTAKRVQR